MRTVPAALFTAFCVCAQAQAAHLPLACGPVGAQFTVQNAEAASASNSPQPGKAILYLIQDEGKDGKHQHFIIRIGMDGSWIGAYRDNSFLAVPVDPGTHHFCASVQSNTSFGRVVGPAHFAAEPGKTYYLRTRFLPGDTSPYVHWDILEIDRIDSDEAEYLIASYPRAEWTPEK